MPEETLTETAAPSPAPTFEIPSDPAANMEWRKTGEIPAAKSGTPKADSTPAPKASADKTAETEPASAPGKAVDKGKSEAATRLEELLADVKNAGFTPAELKTYKREAAKAADAAAPAKAAPETTVNPQEPKAPVKPLQKDFATWELYDQAKDEWTEAIAKFRADEAVAADRQRRAAADQERVLVGKIAEATERYGETAGATINAATAKLNADKQLNPIIRAMLDDSPVLVDVMYVLGSKPEELDAFHALAKSDPGQAIRKLAIIENEVRIELAKPKTGAADDAASGTGRAADGTFLPKTTAKPRPPAPPPPEELNTRRSAPPDAIDSAVKNNDFAAFKAEEDRRDLARRRGA